MIRKFVFIFTVFLVALGILATTVFRSASVRYAFNGETQDGGSDNQKASIDYSFPYQGGILPDHPAWPIKVLRDKFWYLLTASSAKKAELLLLFADKRLLAAKILFEKDKAEIAYSTLTKAEKYLEEVVTLNEENTRRGVDTVGFSSRLAKAALRHRQVIESEILPIAPEDAKPAIVKLLDYSKNAYNKVSDLLKSKGVNPPENPFETE